MLFNEIKRNEIRKFSCSADAVAAGYCVRDWLRAFTFAEHTVKIDARTKEINNSMYS